MPAFLSESLLQGLERRWNAMGATTAGIMKPGLSDEEIDRIAAPLGFDLPDEVRTLYRWHDGSGRYEVSWPRSMWSLEGAVRETIDERIEHEFWRPGWLQILGERPYVRVECLANDLHGPVPVWHEAPEWPPPTRPVFASVGDMITFWISLIDEGLMYWDGKRWQIRDDIAPSHVLEALSGVP